MYGLRHFKRRLAPMATSKRRCEVNGSRAERFRLKRPGFRRHREPWTLLRCLPIKSRFEARRQEVIEHRYLSCTLTETGRCRGCRNGESPFDCMYSALAICSVCGGAEGSLLPECPGRWL